MGSLLDTFESKKHQLLQKELEFVLEHRCFKPALLDMEPDIGYPTEYTMQLMMRIQFLVKSQAPVYVEWVKAIIKNMATNCKELDNFVKSLDKGGCTCGGESTFPQRMWLMVSDATDTYNFGKDWVCFIHSLCCDVMGEKNNNLRNAMLYMVCKVLLVSHITSRYDLLEECLKMASEDVRIVGCLFHHENSMSVLNADMFNDSDRISVGATKCVHNMIMMAPDNDSFKMRVSFLNFEKMAEKTKIDRNLTNRISDFPRFSNSEDTGRSMGLGSQDVRFKRKFFHLCYAGVSPCSHVYVGPGNKWYNNKETAIML